MSYLRETPLSTVVMPAKLYAYNFPRWKHPIVRQSFFGREVNFISVGEPIPPDGWLVLWGMASIPKTAPADIKVLRMEDGFLRSVGLGADLVRPLSWVIDHSGIYYDASCPSDLERLLSTEIFDEPLLARAKLIRQRIVASGLTKYNVSNKSWQRPQNSKQVLLVPGQVESDASLAYGAPGERTNMGLLKHVRTANPDAYLIYKPHPDVLARLRIEGKDEHQANQWCDEVVADVSMGALLEQVDEIHVLTSLTGFEALLRGKTVVCYGQPFYSSWGLTRDVIPLSRRTRRLTIDELVAGVLMRYPLYLSRDGRSLLTPEQALDVLQDWHAQTGGKQPWWRGLFRVILRRVAGVR